MKTDRHLFLLDDAKSPMAEAYRTLRTNIQFSKADKELKVILFTSSTKGEGKSTAVANTAVTLALAGKKVILLDCDLRKPIQHLTFGRMAIGLTNVLCGEKSATEVLQETDIKNLRLLASGPIPPNPSELLGSDRMAEILADLKRQTDYLVIDSSPVLPVTDACVLAPRVDGVILVLGAGAVRLEAARKAKEMLENVRAPMLGVMINRAEPGEEYLYYYSYYGLTTKKGPRGRVI